jgi:hypothetical protein
MMGRRRRTTTLLRTAASGRADGVARRDAENGAVCIGASAGPFAARRHGSIAASASAAAACACVAAAAPRRGAMRCSAASLCSSAAR